MKYNPYLSERQDKPVIVKFEGETDIKSKHNKRVVEVPQERPSWFKSKLED